MKRFFFTMAGVAMIGLVGCEKGTSTAPATMPSGTTANIPAPTNADGSVKERKLTVTSPGSQTVTQDQTDDMKVSISRSNFAGPVDIELRDLPKGVTVTTKEMTIPADESSVRVTIKASPDAQPVDTARVTVVARPHNQTDMPEATVGFDLKVKSKK